MTTQRRQAEEEALLVRTEENELTLEEMSAALPDTPAVMEKVGHSWWHLIYAARGGNWGLAAYYLRRIGKLENALKVLRPKHRERLDRFQRDAMPDVARAIDCQDLEGLERAYAAATEFANRMHEESGYPYIRWVLPNHPPIGLQLSPVESTEPVDESGSGPLP